jgi:hypothetical protein
MRKSSLLLFIIILHFGTLKFKRLSEKLLEGDPIPIQHGLVLRVINEPIRTLEADIKQTKAKITKTTNSKELKELQGPI